MNPLEIQDILYTIADLLCDPRVLLLNNHISQLLNNHPVLTFIRSHTKSDIPKCGPPKLLNFYTGDPAKAAAEHGNLPIIQYLLPTLNINDALIISAEYGHLETVKYLVSIGADHTVNNNFAIRWASSNGHLEIVKYLVSIGADYAADDNYAIRWASHNGHLETVKYLVSIGADHTANNNYAIRWASSNGHSKIVKYLSSL